MECEKIGNGENMKEEPIIYIDEIEAQLQSLEKKNPEGFSTAEMSDALDRSELWCRKKIKTLMKGGKAKYNGKKAATTMDGRRYFAPVYILLRN